MSADFWAGYISGAAGIIIGNPLDLIKVRLQAGTAISLVNPASFSSQFESPGTLIKGATAPILGYGGLNALLFVSYNRTLKLLHDDPTKPSSLWKVCTAGAIGGLATWVVSAPTELVKCRTQMTGSDQSSWSITKDIVRAHGLRGLFFGGTVTSVRDSVGYGFYFCSYEVCKQFLNSDTDTEVGVAAKTLLCGGIAGVISWASIFPLDVIKTRLQTQDFFPQEPSLPHEENPLLLSEPRRVEPKRLGAIQIGRQTYKNEGLSVFFKGLGICSARAFIVNAVQWAVYEWIMVHLKSA